MTGLEGVVTSFQIEDGKTVTLRRSGKVNAEMVFDRRQAHDSLYDVGFGAMMISVVTEDMTVLLNEHGGVLDLDYRVEVEQALCSRNRYHIEIQPIYRSELRGHSRIFVWMKRWASGTPFCPATLPGLTAWPRSWNPCGSLRTTASSAV